MTQEQKLQHVDESLARWHRRLNRAAGAIKKLEAKRRRLLAKPKVTETTDISWSEMTGADLRRPRAHAVIADLPNTLGPAIKEAGEDAGIPGFLKRTPTTDPVAQQIAGEIEAKKKAKAKGRIATMKAKLSGETRKMPLTGKAALEYIASSK